MRRPQTNNSASTDSNVNISLEFYETRIEQLEAQLKDKSNDLDRLASFFEQKNFSLPKNDASSSVNIRKVVKFEPTSQSNQNKIDQLENVNQNLKNALKSLESKLHLKEEENQHMNTDMEILKKDLLNAKSERTNLSKAYEPNEFRDFENNPLIDSKRGDEFWKNIYSEVESLKIKLANAQNELKLREKEHELKVMHAKHANEKSFNDLMRKHKYEINKLIGILTGDEVLGAKSFYDVEGHDSGSLLDDPIRMRLLLNSRSKHLNMTQTIEKQKEIINSLSEKLKNVAREKQYQDTNGLNNENGSLENVAKHYETQLKAKNREIEKFRIELDQMLNLLKTLQI